jgi:hypothetical protein
MSIRLVRTHGKPGQPPNVNCDPRAYAVPQASDRKGADLATWHCRLGHASESTILSMASKGVVNGLIITGGKPEGRCEDRKQHAEPFDNAPVPKNPLEIVHIDLMGPFRIKSLGGAKYTMTIDNSATSMGAVYFLQLK